MLAAGVGGAADASESVAERWGGLRTRDAVRSARGRGNGGRRGAASLLAADALRGGRRVSYAVEFEYATLRANAPGLSDARLRRAMARAAATWCRRLVAFEFRER